MKESFYEELEQVFDHIPKYHMNIVLRDFKAKLGREFIFQPTIGNESLHQVSNDNGVRIVNSDTSKDLDLKSPMSPYTDILKYSWTSPDRKTHNQIDQIFIDNNGIPLYPITIFQDS